MRIIKSVVNKILEWKSFKTERKILIIESDDWGGIRTDSAEVLKELNKINKRIQNDRFTQLDNLEGQNDLMGLFEVLHSVKDKEGRPAKLTANVSVANPDFDKIEQSEFSQFFYEPFYETIEKRANGEKVIQLWNEGIEKKVWQPQLHGREHLHALAWLDELRAGNSDLTKAFKLGSFGIPYTTNVTQRRRNLQASLDRYDIEGEKEFQLEWLKESCSIFQDYFGFRSATFIPPAYIWDDDILETLREQGIQGIQGIKLQYRPNNGAYKRRVHYTGQETKDKMKYIVRNVFFEPASKPENDWVDSSLAGIELAFNTKQPAIVGSHRINFIGSINPTNRDKNLKSLKQLLMAVEKKYEDIEFLSSDELVNLIYK